MKLIIPAIPSRIRVLRILQTAEDGRLLDLFGPTAVAKFGNLQITPLMRFADRKSKEHVSSASDAIGKPQSIIDSVGTEYYSLKLSYRW